MSALFRENSWNALVQDKNEGGKDKRSMSFNPLWQRQHVQLEFRTKTREEGTTGGLIPPAAAELAPAAAALLFAHGGHTVRSLSPLGYDRQVLGSIHT